MKKNLNESEKFDLNDPNIYLKVFTEKVKPSEKITMDSIEVVLSNMTSLHNTIGKSYEFVATILGTLLNQIKQQKSEENEKEEEYSQRILELKEQVTNFQKNLSETQKSLTEAQKKNLSLENELSKKDAIISKLKRDLEDVQKKSSDKKLSIAKYANSPESPNLDELELPPHDDRETHSEGDHHSRNNVNNKRRLEEPEVFDEEFNRDEDEHQSEIDKFKYKKLFKKVKKNEPIIPNKASSNSVLYEKTKLLVPVESVNKSNGKQEGHEETDLHNLLNNFSESKGFEKRNLSDHNPNSNHKDDSNSSSKIGKDKLTDSKLLKKEGTNFFTQQAAVFNDSLEKELFPPESSAKPITSKSKSSQIMVKMMKSNQKRNASSIGNHLMPTDSSKSFVQDFSKEISKEEMKSEAFPTRGVHRSKVERENLQGFECDQCEKFYKFIGDGNQMNKGGICDKCSRHRDKFPLPATPELFYKNFSLDSQE